LDIILKRHPVNIPVNNYFETSRNTVDDRDKAITVSRMKLDDAAARLEALGNPTRLKIYRALVRAGAEGLPVGRLQEKLDVAASTLSHHLKTLVGVGLVTQTREGTTLICHTNYELMRGLLEYLVEECCAEGAGCPPARLPRVA
jgi:DNA-binding transcriptional ArsR family regulator